MKKIDIITSDSLNSSIGPVQTIKRIRNSQDFFKSRGYEINVFSADAHAPSVEDNFKAKDGLALRLARLVARYLSLHTKFYPKNRLKMMHDKAKHVLDYYASLNRHPDIIVFHNTLDCYEYLKGYRMNSVKVACFHHTDGSDEGNKMVLVYFPKLRGTEVERQMEEELKYVFSEIDTVGCITKVEEKNLLELFPFLKGKTSLVVNGISDLTKEQHEDAVKIRESTPEKKYRFISVGSMNGRKGHKEVIEALQQMNPELRREVQVLFVGGGRDKEKLESAVDDYGLKDIVRFVGRVPNEEVYKFQAQSNICILISKVEGLPLGLLEGLRSGLALVSTNVSGIPEIIDDGINGKLINYSFDDLLNLFNHLDKYDWDEMGMESRKKFEEYYNFPRMRNDYLAMLDKLTK